MNKYVVKTSQDSLSVLITDTKNKYNLHLVRCNFPLKFHNYTFETLRERNQNEGGFITARNIGEYDEEIKDLDTKLHLQYIEVGAGLGEFTPNLIKSSNGNLAFRPIIIDPVNYDVLYSLIEFAVNLNVDEELNCKLIELQERCNIISDKSKVNLINTTLEIAVSTFPKIAGIADVVIDNVGASHYTDNHESAWFLEYKLLKKEGILFSEVVNSRGVFKPDKYIQMLRFMDKEKYK